MPKFNYSKLSFDNRSIIYQAICCTKYLSLVKVIDEFLINYDPTKLNDDERNEIFFKIWADEICRKTQLKNNIYEKSPYLENLIQSISHKYDLKIDLNTVNYSKINSPRQDYYDSLQSASYKRIAFLSKIISATEHFEFSYSERDHAKDSAKIAKRVATNFNLSTHSIYHLKCITIDHSLGEISLGKSGGNAYNKILKKYEIDEDEFQFHHYYNVLRSLIEENASFARIDSACCQIFGKNIEQLPHEAKSLLNKLSEIGIINNGKKHYLENSPNFESQILNWCDGISWVTNDLKLLFKTRLYSPSKIVDEVKFLKGFFERTEADDLNHFYIDEAVDKVREFLIEDYVKKIAANLKLNAVEPEKIKNAEEICKIPSLLGDKLSPEIMPQVTILINILSENLYKNFLYTVGNKEDNAKQDLWFNLLYQITERLLDLYEKGLSLPEYYQNLLEKNISYILTKSYRKNLNQKQNIIIGIIKFLGTSLTDREVLRLCDIVLRDNGTNLEDFLNGYKDRLSNIYDLKELISEF